MNSPKLEFTDGAIHPQFHRERNNIAGGDVSGEAELRCKGATDS